MGIAHDVSPFIEEWLRSNENRTISLLAKLSGIPYTTIRRIRQKETDPTFENFLAIMGVVSTTDKTVELAKKHWPAEGKYLADQSKTYELAAPNLQEFIVVSREHWAIITMASVSEGTTRQQIAERLGSGAEDPLHEMLDAAVLVEKNSRVYTAQRDFSITNMAIMLRQLSLAVEMFPRNNVSKFGFAGFFSEGLTEEKAAEANAIIRDASLKLQALNKPENAGPIIVYAGMFINKL